MSKLVVSKSDFTEAQRTELAEALADWFQDRLGLPTELLFADITNKAYALLSARSLEAHQNQAQAEVDKSKQWAAERGLIYLKAYLDKYGISEHELRAALDTGMLRYTFPPGRGGGFWSRVTDDRPLTADELVSLADRVLLTANQAAERLGIDRATFDRLKKKHKLEPAEMRRTHQSKWPFAVYRQSDIDRLQNGGNVP